LRGHANPSRTRFVICFHLGEWKSEWLLQVSGSCRGNTAQVSNAAHQHVCLTGIPRISSSSCSRVSSISLWRSRVSSVAACGIITPPDKVAAQLRWRWRFLEIIRLSVLCLPLLLEWSTIMITRVTNSVSPATTRPFVPLLFLVKQCTINHCLAD
jgi:hypothetical protein